MCSKWYKGMFRVQKIQVCVCVCVTGSHWVSMLPHCYNNDFEYLTSSATSSGGLQWQTNTVIASLHPSRLLCCVSGYDISTAVATWNVLYMEVMMHWVVPLCLSLYSMNTIIRDNTCIFVCLLQRIHAILQQVPNLWAVVT